MERVANADSVGVIVGLKVATGRAVESGTSRTPERLVVPISDRTSSRLCEL